MPQEAEGRLHLVRPGETASGLAFEHGLLPDALWQHERNGPLREQRSDPEVLLPGDEIFIPKKRSREESAATGQRHRFVRKGVAQRLELTIVDAEDQPFANERYVVTIDGRSSEGRLDGDGRLELRVSPSARAGRIQVGEDGALLDAPLELGHLDPVSAVSGVQARLQNLGYYGGAVDGQPNAELDRAVAAFREARGLQGGAAVDDALRDELVRVFGR